VIWQEGNPHLREDKTCLKMGDELFWREDIADALFSNAYSALMTVGALSGGSHLQVVYDKLRGSPLLAFEMWAACKVRWQEKLGVPTATVVKILASKPTISQRLHSSQLLQPPTTPLAQAEPDVGDMLPRLRDLLDEGTNPRSAVTETRLTQYISTKPNELYDAFNLSWKGRCKCWGAKPSLTWGSGFEHIGEKKSNYSAAMRYQAVSREASVRDKVMGQLLSAMASKAEPKEIGARASEALARIIAAEVKPDSDGGGPPPEQPVQLPSGSTGALCGLFLAACRGEAASKEIVPQLMAQLSSNEVIEAKQAAEGFTRSEQECKIPIDGVGWLALAKILSPNDTVKDLPAALVEAGAIRAAASIMARFIEDSMVQLTGIEAMSSLVGNRWAGLRAFADVGGMERVEEAMRHHGQDALIQTKGVRALGSGVQWPQDVQERARYSHRRAIDLTKTAMSQHGMDAELQIAALEALAKYLDKTRCVSEIKDGGGEGLVKMMMTTHHSSAKVQQWGRHVLTGIGADPNWAPKTSAGAS
ncbi:unnamed protein product, partial [Symbiodinium necroappetens]